MTPKQDPPPPLCLACGGSGTPYKQLGPFLSAVQKRWRDHVEAHLAARREVFRLIDRDIGRQLVSLAKAMDKGDCSLTDVLVECGMAHEKAAIAWTEGKKTEAIRHLKKIAVSITYVLESIEAEAQKDAK